MSRYRSVPISEEMQMEAEIPGRRKSSRPTITDVAQLAGVSRAAVSQVFNERGNISDATRERIREAAAKLQWTPSATAVALRRSKSQTVGLVLHTASEVPDLAGSSASLIAGIEAILSPRGYGLLLYSFGMDSDAETKAYRELADARRVDGVILTDSRIGDPRFALMRSLELPAVLVGTPWTDDPIPHLDDGSDVGITQAVEHLASLGHRRLAFIGGPMDRVQPVLRRTAYEQALEAAGLTSVATIATDYSAAESAVQTAALLALTEPPTAIVYGSDGMAIAGIKTARNRGVSVPGQLSVVGYDGLPVGEWVEPELTTVVRDAGQRGRAAAARLLTLLEVEVDEQPISPPQLLVRASTGPVPAPAP
jgi:DNA-binding LacI/PurR family transcriptional regulator